MPIHDWDPTPWVVPVTFLHCTVINTQAPRTTFMSGR
jgi:hypothetical protein